MVRQYLSSAVGDLILSTAAGTPASTTYVDTMLLKANDYYNEHNYRGYCYEGDAIGQEREVSDWDLTGSPAHTITFDPAFSPAIASGDEFELHYIFTEKEYRRAINLAIECLAGKYLVDIKDETTIRLTSTEDNLENTVYTWEYDLPTSMLYLYRVITEHGVSGVKLTGDTVSGTFTAGETVTGDSSGATGEFAYQGTAYIRLRKVSGTFTVGEKAAGNSAYCDNLTAVESETVGLGKFYDQDKIDPRNYSIIKSYTPKLKLDKRYYSIDEDLYLRLEGQGTQPIVDDDTDVIYLPPDWVVAKAITFLPQNKVQSNKLDEVYRRALIVSSKEPIIWPDPRAERIVE